MRLTKHLVVTSFILVLRTAVVSKLVNSATTAAINAKINEVKNQMRNNTNLAATTVLTAVENKIPDHSKYITTPEFNKLTAEHFPVRLAQVI